MHRRTSGLDRWRTIRGSNHPSSMASLPFVNDMFRVLHYLIMSDARNLLSLLAITVVRDLQ